MQSTTSHKQVNETEQPKQFAELIDLTDANLEEISAPGFGRIQGGHHDDDDVHNTFVRVLVIRNGFGSCFGFGSCAGFGFGGLGFDGLGLDGLGLDGLGFGGGRVARAANAIDNFNN